jgi:hypothetical protein
MVQVAEHIHARIQKNFLRRSKNIKNQTSKDQSLSSYSTWYRMNFAPPDVLLLVAGGKGSHPWFGSGFDSLDRPSPGGRSLSLAPAGRVEWQKLEPVRQNSVPRSACM